VAPFSSEDRRIIITAEGKLTLRGADASDTGLYQCIATNYLDADILVFRVTVLSPDVEETEVNGVQLSRPLGENLVFDCSFSGSPQASVQWILPDHSVLDKVSVSAEGTLVIEHVSVYDRGHYKCIASNPAGADTATVRLQVVAAPPGIMEEKRQQLKASVSQNLWLPCTEKQHKLLALHVLVKTPVKKLDSIIRILAC
uniref:Ig-like domain-containing protein n=1 Tax=Lates calcarifer TaxID=8187 RepID=A0A4W6C0I5_LATCA